MDHNNDSLQGDLSLRLQTPRILITAHWRMVEKGNVGCWRRREEVSYFAYLFTVIDNALDGGRIYSLKGKDR